MTTLLQVNRVLDAHTWEILGDHAEPRLVTECAASSDGSALANVSDAGVWRFGHDAGYVNRHEVRIARPMLTAKSGIADLALLLMERGVRLTQMSPESGLIRVRIERNGGGAMDWSRAIESEAWRAVNEALFRLESGRR